MLNHKQFLEEPILVGCSGGPDSLCLLHLLYKQNKKIICTHFNHRWTPLSGKAVTIVEKICKELKIPFVLGNAQKAGRNSETEAREERYAFFIQIAKEYKVKTIVTAHHLDDQIETFFLRVLRGTGLNGLGCIQPIRELENGINLVRPLLNIEKSKLIEYCQSQNLFFYEDPTNKELDIKRNQLRMQVLPLIERIQPNYKKQVDNLIQIISDQNKFLDNYLNTFDFKSYTNCLLFNEQQTAIQRLVLKRLLEDFNVNISFELIEELRQKILNKQKSKISLTDNLYFEINSIRFQIIKELPKTNLQIEPQIFDLSQKEIIINNIAKLKVEKINLDYNSIPIEKNASKVFVNLQEFLDFKFVLRSRQAGDRFQPLNCNYSLKLKNFLINRKIDKENLLFLSLENSSNILWIPTLEISDLIKVEPEQKSTHCLSFELFKMPK